MVRPANMPAINSAFSCFFKFVFPLFWYKVLSKLFQFVNPKVANSEKALVFGFKGFLRVPATTHISFPAKMLEKNPILFYNELEKYTSPKRKNGCNFV